MPNRHSKAPTSTADLARQQPSGDVPATLTATDRNHLFELAQHAFASRQLHDARDILHGLVVLDRDDASTWALLGRVEKALGDLINAAEALSMAVSQNPGDIASVLELAEAHLAAGDRTQAQSLATQLGTQMPLDDEQLRRVAHILDVPPDNDPKENS